MYYFRKKACQLIAKIKRTGPNTTTTVVVEIGKETEFKYGRHFLSNIAPRQYLSGESQVIMNEIKRATSIYASCLFTVFDLS